MFLVADCADRLFKGFTTAIVNLIRAKILEILLHVWPTKMNRKMVAQFIGHTKQEEGLSDHIFRI